MIRFSNEKGVTLVALVIAIILLLIISAIAIPEGKKAVENSRLLTFSTELQAMQIEVNKLNQKLNNGDESVLNMGYTLENSEKENTAFEGANIADTEDFRHFSKDVLEDMGLSGFAQDFLVNVKTRQVVSLQGIEYKGEMFYTIDQLPNGTYNIEQEDIKSETTFNLTSRKDGSKYYLVITDISYSGNIKKGTIYYGQRNNGETEWKVAQVNTENTSCEIEVRKPGDWFVKIVDAAGNESDEASINIVK